MLRLDRDGVVRAVSASVSELLHRPAADCSGRHLRALVPPADHDALRTALAGTGGERTATCRLLRGDGDVVWVELRVGAEAGGERLAWVRPLTDRPGGVALSLDEGSASEHLFRLAFDHAAVPMAITTVTGRFRRVNASMVDLLGHSSADLLASSSLDLVHPEDVAAVLAGGRRLLRGEADRVHLECRYLHRDGRSLQVELAGSLLRGRDELPAGFLHQAVDITERTQQASELAHRASHDPLTDLPNRHLLQEALRTALAVSRRHGGLVGVVFLDLDGFKGVNDTVGHAGGDAVLVEVARRLRAVVREGDVVGRMGGDEFVVVARSESAVEVPALVARLEEVFAEAMAVCGHELVVSASIGVAVSDGHGDPDALIGRADRSMYEAKGSASAGRGD